MKSTPEGRKGSDVTGEIPDNVKVAAIIYAMNDRRTFFPATRFLVSPKTSVFNTAFPGGHGGATLRYRGVDSQLEALYSFGLTERTVAGKA